MKQGRDMPRLEEAKAKFKEMDDEDKVITVVGVFAALLLSIVTLILLVVLVKELTVPLLIGVAGYAAGVKFFGWPIPKFVKKLFK